MSDRPWKGGGIDVVLEVFVTAAFAWELSDGLVLLMLVLMLWVRFVEACFCAAVIRAVTPFSPLNPLKVAGEREETSVAFARNLVLVVATLALFPADTTSAESSKATLSRPSPCRRGCRVFSSSPPFPAQSSCSLSSSDSFAVAVL